MSLTLRQLQIFAKIAQHESVTRASSELHLTQSAVSMALAELERFSDTPLFKRQGKRLRLNDRGRQLVPLVKKLLAQLDDVELFLNESVRQPVGILNVGASTTIGNYLLPTLIGQFTAQYPQARIRLYVANAEQIELGVDDGRYDLGLSEGYLHINRIDAQPWRSDQLVIITSPQHPWAQSCRADCRMLRDGEWIMRERGSGTREVFETAMQKQGIQFRIGMELGHTEAIKKAVEAGSGCACLSRMAVQRELDHGWLVEIHTPLQLDRRLLLLTKEKSSQTPLYRTFIAALRNWPHSQKQK